VPLGLPMEPSGVRGYPVRGLGCSRRGEPIACVSVAILKPIFKLNDAVTRA
jgi:hypothetical protein